MVTWGGVYRGGAIFYTWYICISGVQCCWQWIPIFCCYKAVWISGGFLVILGGCKVCFWNLNGVQKSILNRTSLILLIYITIIDFDFMFNCYILIPVGNTETPSNAPLHEAYPHTTRPHWRPTEGNSDKSPPFWDYKRIRPFVSHHLITLRPTPSHWEVWLP